MAEVIRFPIEYRESEHLDDDTRNHYMMALRFVLNSIRSGEVDPTKMFLMYGTRERKGDARLGASDTETIWSYLNLGFDPDGLTKAMCRVLDDIEERNDDADW